MATGLNLFQDENKRTEESIRHQKLTTRIYLILVSGMFLSSTHPKNIFVIIRRCFSRSCSIHIIENKHHNNHPNKSFVDQLQNFTNGRSR